MHKKRGTFTYIMFVLFIIAAIALILKDPTISGNQVIDPTTARMSLESALNSMGSSIAGGSLCVAISDAERPMSYKALNMGGSWTVTETDDFFCDGMNSEDFIAVFSSYDSFSRVLNDPSPRSLATAVMTREFEITPSRYMEQGGNVVCDATFKVKYCPALTAMADPEQLIDADLVCCLDSLTKDQKGLLEQHMMDGSYEEEIGILQQPSAGLDIASLLLPIVLVVIVLGGLGVFMVVRKSHKPSVTKNGGMPVGSVAGVQPVGSQQIGAQPTSIPGQPMVGVAGQTGTVAGAQPMATQQLMDYTIQVLQQGYTPEELLQHYLEQGWNQGTAMKVINDAVNRINQA